MMDDLCEALATDLDGAFPSLVGDMGPRLFWGIRRIVDDHQEAEDLTQETLIKAYQALSQYEKSRVRSLELQAWLWTIALNLGRNHLRARSRRPTAVELSGSEGVEDPEMVDGDAWNRRLRHLTRHQRTAVVLRHVVGLGIAEIAEATGRAEGTVKSDIHRGLTRLKTVMEDE